MPQAQNPSPTFHSLEYLRKTNSLNLGPHKKVLIANRGEIAIRLIRAAHELGLQTVGIFSYEDRFNMHRYKADESYQIGEHGEFTPVGAYLAQDAIIAIAKEHHVSMIHPGYGFLSENADFARKVEAAGIAFVGPSADVIDRLGDKTAARTIAIACKVPVVPGTPGPITTKEEIETFVQEHGFPIIIKAAMGGGGRGMRVVWKNSELADAFSRAKSEALAAFGDGTVFVERFLHKPKHIEVQLLADSEGKVLHLFDRDCSVQRRHQKVVEIAPSIDLEESVRQAMLADAIKLAEHVGYRNAGTAEFLVDQEGRHYFIEINPRIQVEHTVTEEVTGLDIVSMQMQIAAGLTFKDLEISQDAIETRGCAIQCRITTEDPAQNFQPDTGRIEVYRSAGGNGVRLDGGSGFAGSIITPHYDSLLVKVTCYGDTYEKARRRMLSALVEFRIRGVKTNIAFLQNVLTHPTFRSGKCWTTFIDDTPELFDIMKSQNRAHKILAYLGDMIVNGSSVKGQVGEPKHLMHVEIPQLERPDGPLKVTTDYPKGWRQIFLDQGPEAFAQAIRKHPGLLIMDTTWRDAHQSLLATRLRTIDMLNIARTTGHALHNAFSLEMWGGATFDVAMRFLYEDPWARLDKLRALVPHIPFQMLLRGANAVGYTSYPDNVIYDFCEKARKHGIDVFRVFDSLNYFENLKLGIDAVRAAGGIVEGTVCYTGDVSDSSRTKHTLQYYLDLVAQLVDYGIHILGIKDMAGLLKPKAARMLIGAIRERFPDLPIHVHTHDTAGTGVASMLACAEAGADIVDAAIDSMSGITSQPSMGALVSALQGTSYDTGISFKDIMSINDYWEQIRLLYSCFDPGVRSSDAGVYEHEMPGGQYTNLMFQAQSLGLGSQWKQVREAYIEANKLCGDIVKVTPSSKVVGDFAQFLVSNKLNEKDVLANARSLSFPTSVVEYFQGYLGQPYGGFPEPLRSNIIKDLPRIDGRPGASLAPFDFGQLQTDLTKKYGRSMRPVELSSAALYPKVFDEYRAMVEKYGDLSVLPTHFFLAPLNINEECHIEIQQGKLLIIKYVACGPLNPASGRRDVYFELNGEVRVMSIEDKSTSTAHAIRPKADTSRPGDIGAPMAGVVVEMRVKEGAEVKEGDPLCILSAMKMETVVSAPVSGHIESLATKEGDSLSAGDLIVRIIA
ncbi:pyruvate carboxylase [Dimargaris cristalligena]|uniref:Pyruvate carboxylase n=1 Tax=Dimargaris cristalligena TaxID=215637 RepID=A0A4P9ZRC7_9FUNG|nr:pyruvate carboxylase [Dimargaris cristalligena]|eukprot:RKP34990.1 pyruvate carboxylase [Dimargaris cristalligena]